MAISVALGVAKAMEQGFVVGVIVGARGPYRYMRVGYFRGPWCDKGNGAGLCSGGDSGGERSL